MCYKNPGPRCSNHTSKAYNRAVEKHGADSPEAQAALNAWLRTPEGIKHLRSEGFHEVAMEYERERAEAIKAYHEAQAKAKAAAEPTYDFWGFDEEGNNRFTGKPYDGYGFDKDGIHRETGTEYDLHGVNRLGYDQDGFDEDGYNSEGYDEWGYDREGYDTDGYNADGIDSFGYTRDGDYVDPDGNDEDGDE